MPTFISSPTRVAAVGNKPKVIDEFIGRVNSGTDSLSVARMQSPEGWREPGQIPEFDEFTLVLKGTLTVRYRTGQKYIQKDVEAGEAVIARSAEWVQYSTDVATEYIAICLPAFSPGTVHRDPS